MTPYAVQTWWLYSFQCGTTIFFFFLACQFARSGVTKSAAAWWLTRDACSGVWVLQKLVCFDKSCFSVQAQRFALFRAMWRGSLERSVLLGWDGFSTPMNASHGDNVFFEAPFVRWEFTTLLWLWDSFGQKHVLRKRFGNQCGLCRVSCWFIDRVRQPCAIRSSEFTRWGVGANWTIISVVGTRMSIASRSSATIKFRNCPFLSWIKVHQSSVGVWMRDLCDRP